MGAIYVRARDGALYLNPVLVTARGFVCFDSSEPPELVVWLDPSKTMDLPDFTILLRRIFGDYQSLPSGCGADIGSARLGKRSLRVVPGTEPWQFMPACSFFFELNARIPRPQLHAGTERHATRCRGIPVLELPRNYFDLAQIEIPPQVLAGG